MSPAFQDGVKHTKSGVTVSPATLDNAQDTSKPNDAPSASRTQGLLEKTSTSLPSDPLVPNQGKVELVGDPDANASLKETYQDKESGKPENSSLSSTLSGNKMHISPPTRADASTTLRSLTTSNGSGSPDASNARKAPRPSFFSRLIYLLVPCVSPRAHLEDIQISPPPGSTNDKDTHQKYDEVKTPIPIRRPVATSTPEDVPEKLIDAKDTSNTSPPAVQANAEPRADDSVQPSADLERPFNTDLDNVMSGGVQQPGSGAILDRTRGGEDSNQNGVGEESEGSSFTEDDDLDDINGMDEVDDDEDRLILNGGTGIPIGPDGIPRPLLPPIAAQHIGRKCLILDLDETLVHSSFKSIQQADYVVPVEIEYHWHNVYVIKRPGVDNFLKKMGEIYEVVVFTASLSKYADPVLDKLDTHRVVTHRLFRESCYNHKGNYVKDLSQLGRPIADTIILDNSPASYIFHPNNAVPVSSWFNDPHDTELTDLVPFLADLGIVDDVRGVLDGAR
ncbi:hypothetical protein APHAL10511_000064 [Amanita phalloides]|nr:hypothetical protein APHAL10511_000064 [Amanita phalloides]